MTECNQKDLIFHGLGRRDVVARFDGGAITSDAGGVLLRELEQRTGILQRFSDCFTDHRDAGLIEHTVLALVKQRTFGLCLGYEDLNDHDDLRHDPLLAVLVGKTDPTGADRLRQRDRGKALAGKSTLNRLELTPPGAENRIKEQQLCLFADRTSCETMRANQLRLWFSSVAYTLLVALRQFGLHGTEMESAQCDTIRLKLLKIGAQVRVTFRKVWLSLAESYPYRVLFL